MWNNNYMLSFIKQTYSFIFMQISKCIQSSVFMTSLVRHFMGYVHYVIDTCFTYHIILHFMDMSPHTWDISDIAMILVLTFHIIRMFTCISSNILSCKLSNSFSKTSRVVMTCTWHCHFVLSYYHTYILKQHIIFIITAVQSHIHVQWSSLCHMHMYHITDTLSNMTCHISYIHVLHNIDLVMSRVLFILNVSFYPTHTQYKIAILKTLYVWKVSRI